MSSKEELRQKLRSKIKQKQQQRLNTTPTEPAPNMDKLTKMFHSKSKAEKEVMLQKMMNMLQKEIKIT